MSKPARRPLRPPRHKSKSLRPYMKQHQPEVREFEVPPIYPEDLEPLDSAKDRRTQRVPAPPKDDQS